MVLIPPATSSTLVFYVNGKKVVDENVNPEWTLLYYLRTKLRLTGTKLGCAEGGCGACTVMVSRIDRRTKKIVHLAVNACLAPICSVHGTAVTTVEGIGSTKTKLHPVQERMAKSHGSQCGFCTPGIVMSMYALLRSLPKPTMADLEVAFQGNLCRCTGYRAIIEGFRTFTEEWEVAQQLQNGNRNGCNGNTTPCGMGDQCCKNKNRNKEILFDKSEFTPYDSSQEPIFPPQLQLSTELDEQYLIVKSEKLTWYRPTRLVELLELKGKFPNAKIIVGNTEIGVEVKFKNCQYPVMIQPTMIDELSVIEASDKGIKFGAACTLNDITQTLKRELSIQPEYKTRVFKAILEMLHWFAGKQIRNVAAIGGNIMTGSPISDMNPILMAAKVELHLENTSDSRVVTMDENFFTGYRRNIIAEDEILKAIVIPYTKQDQYFFAYKQAKRRDDDIAIVNCAANVEFHADSNIVKNFSIAYGGMAPTTVMALKTMNAIIGREWSDAMLDDIYSKLVEDLPLSPSAPGGMIQYRRSLTLSFFFKFYLAVSECLFNKNQTAASIPDEYKSAVNGFHTLEPKNAQFFQVVPEDQPNIDLVGRPMVHASAYKQATGEAVYCDDIPHYENELYLALVTSTRAHAKILKIDASKALEVPGVHKFFCHEDIPVERNEHGAVVHDEQIFNSHLVNSQGQIIGAIVADDQLIAQRAAKLVKIEYEDLQPVIISIEDAIKANSFYPGFPKQILKGDYEAAFKTVDHIVEKEFKMGGQEQFYLETHCTVAVPKNEDGEMEIFCSTQNPSETQRLTAHMLGIPCNRVVVRVKRLGGGFGGKESRASLLSLPCALAASQLGRPVRCMLDRDEDMVITGGRHPFMGRYKLGFNKTGEIIACDIELYNNAGYSWDLSAAVMERAMFHFENSYNIPHCRVRGFVCKTNLPSNTAFRGFGGPQGMFFAENMIRDVAEVVGKPVEELSYLNLYREGHHTHYNQTLTYCTLERCWEECLDRSGYQKWKEEIAEFNRQNRWKKRGIAIVPTKFGIAFTFVVLNQSGALVHVYTDGSVLLTHGGTEMGQGLHTKMIQVASRVLGIPTSYIHISETSTDKVPNTSPTAASAGSDLNGMAVLNACQVIADRLQPYIKENPKGTWEDWVKKAYFDRISLSAAGFYKTPEIGYSFDTNSGVAFNYFTYGAAASVVEIDCLTGDHQVLRTDVVMDLGESLNPAIDIGQVEGGFIQGYGLFTMEELIYSPTGTLYSRGPGMYKIPGFSDIPAEFNVSLLRGAPNPRAVYSSKAVGEPPLFLASSIFFAIKDAITSARQDVGLQSGFRMDSPATAARIRMACQDNITEKFPEPDPTSYTPWNVLT